MIDLDAWQEVWETLRSNKLRAFLTALGVFWGVFMLILMLGIGNGLERGVIHNLSGLTNYSVYVWPQRTSMPYKGLPPGRYVKFNNADIAAIARAEGVEHVAPRLQLGAWRDGQNVSFGAKKANFNVIGDSPEVQFVEPLIFDYGRFINLADMAEERKVVVIGEEVRKHFFGDENPLGKYIQIKRVYFQVIGVLRTLKTGDDGERMMTSVYVPFSTFQTAFNMKDRVGWFALTARTSLPAALVEQNVRRSIIEGHRIHPDDSLAIGSFNAAEKYQQIQGLFRGIRKFVWFVGTLTLFAGMLGVSNILLIIVKERTKEIGVRKALGATPWSIVSLVVAEGVLLTSLAGYLGVVAGVLGLEAAARAVKHLPNAPLSQPEISLQVALTAVLVLIVAGVVAGIVPARHAARVHPVEALRAE
ncbi:MAG TPA: ABC transporter permease [Polyangiaceae bacterium]|nr:ABC transporter permease [Polyangiaceae bacterium]